MDDAKSNSEGNSESFRKVTGFLEDYTRRPRLWRGVVSQNVTKYTEICFGSRGFDAHLTTKTGAEVSLAAPDRLHARSPRFSPALSPRVRRYRGGAHREPLPGPAQSS